MVIVPHPTPKPCRLELTLPARRQGSSNVARLSAAEQTAGALSIDRAVCCHRKWPSALEWAAQNAHPMRRV